MHACSSNTSIGQANNNNIVYNIYYVQINLINQNLTFTSPCFLCEVGT